MPIKIENQSNAKLPRGFIESIDGIVESIPRDHLRGMERIRLVDYISDARVRTQERASLPGLYHPRQGSQTAWMEIALNVIIPPKVPFHKRLLQRLSFKGNLAATIFSIVGQHYHLTLRHSVKKTNLEGLVRAYAETRMRAWASTQNRFRYKLFKPFQPTLERWAKSLQRRAKQAEPNRKIRK